MKLSAWVQKFHISLTAITWMGFVVVFAMWGSYVFFFRNKELTTQNSELQYLREENRHLAERNQELERQLATIRSNLEETGKTVSDANAELREGSHRSFVYTVKKGDTIWDIAKMYNVDVNALMRWNNLNPRSQIFPGDTLTIILKE
jgi:LysM repeat protein